MHSVGSGCIRLSRSLSFNYYELSQSIAIVAALQLAEIILEVWMDTNWVLLCHYLPVCSMLMT